MGRLTTHILDTALGRPASGVRVDLYRLNGTGRRADWPPLASLVSNSDGRCDSPLMEANPLPVGVYELVFHVGGYFREHDASMPKPPFLDEVVVRFGIADPAGHYHVPLLISPYGYSTYRGS
jgi:5-hydroxyisourate hydrolase